MKLPYGTPHTSGPARARAAREVREFASDLARIRPQATTQTNDEETDHGATSCIGQNHDAVYPANFTKGLGHDDYGVLIDPADYRAFVKGINGPEHDYLDTEVRTAADHPPANFVCTVNGSTPEWRGWESPRAGHVYELEGPDPGSVGMAPAPRVGSSELAAEMAEVYALALLRDVPFTEIANGGDQQLCDGGGQAQLDANTIVTLLSEMKFYSGNNPVSSTPNNAAGGLNRFERNRRRARTGTALNGDLTTQNLFRGSAPGVANGPYISQFMLVGNDSLAGGVANGIPSYPALNGEFERHDGYIRYGSQIIDQRGMVHRSCLDYMTCWQAWLDVQNGANIQNANQFEGTRRFITTPRDLATYVHFDALYQAYLNACLLLLGDNTATSKGFPEPSPAGIRTPFATYGGPHILSLTTEVATRCLKAVRRQKFNHHRRARPEALAGRLVLAHAAGTLGERLGCAKEAFDRTVDELPADLLTAVMAHNAAQNAANLSAVQCSPATIENEIAGHNILLPMAFPEGSPMHPAYGAGHATVAGGCVTMLKAFFEMYESNDSNVLRTLPFPTYAPNAQGTALTQVSSESLTIQGELNKLAANISIGRNMAGVHYYSDYYDSLRMGERIAVGILLEQAITYGDEVEMTFDSFDGDRLTISGRGRTCPSLTVLTPDGSPSSARSWWLRHVVGEEIVEDA